MEEPREAKVDEEGDLNSDGPKVKLQPAAEQGAHPSIPEGRAAETATRRRSTTTRSREPQCRSTQSCNSVSGGDGSDGDGGVEVPAEASDGEVGRTRTGRREGELRFIRAHRTTASTADEDGNDGDNCNGEGRRRSSKGHPALIRANYENHIKYSYRGRAGPPPSRCRRGRRRRRGKGPEATRSESYSNKGRERGDKDGRVVKVPDLYLILLIRVC